jgi:hypothetical protein
VKAAGARFEIRLVVAAAALGSALLPAPAAFADGCDLPQLHQALLEHDKARIEFQWKMETGFIQRTKRGDMTIARKRNEPLYAGPAATIQAIAKHLADLDGARGTFALVYEPRAKGCVWLIGPDGSVSASRAGWVANVAGAIRDRLGVTTRSFLLPVSGEDPGAAADKPAAAPDKNPPSLGDIGAALIPPQLMAEIERRAHTLLILPANDLSTVPFAALPATQPRAHLIDIATPIILPSVDGLFFWVHAPSITKKSNALIVGDPDLSGDTKWRFASLPGARQEAMTVANLVGKVALVGKDANATKVRSGLAKGNLSLIYFATHGISDAVNPMDDSFLALSGEHLRAADIKLFKYPEVHPLVVMSACQSGRGKVFTGGVFGLARAWIYAGASQVLASQWNVDDAATARLMEQFMGRVTKGESVQRAFQQAIVTTRTSHPDIAQWGSFNLFGYPQPTR